MFVMSNRSYGVKVIGGTLWDNQILSIFTLVYNKIYAR